MIAYPITYPMGSDRPNPNRPRIAHIESCRVVPYRWLRCICMTSGSRRSRPGFDFRGRPLVDPSCNAEGTSR